LSKQSAGWLRSGIPSSRRRPDERNRNSSGDENAKHLNAGLGSGLTTIPLLSKIPSTTRKAGYQTGSHPSGDGSFPEAAMGFLLYGVILFIGIAILLLVEGFLRAYWVEVYFLRGIKIYERRFPGGGKSLADVYTRIVNDNSDDGLQKFVFHIPKENDHLLFRNRFGRGFSRNISWIHGTINADEDNFIILGFLGLSEIVYGVLLPFALFIFFIISNLIVLLLIAAAVLIIISPFFYSAYSSSRKILERI
jgi:hypothetical protein